MTGEAKWVMVGWELPGGRGVTVWASRHIHGDVHFQEMGTIHLDPYTHQPVGATYIPCRFGGEASQAVQVDAATFAEAIADILRGWGGVINDPFSALGGPKPDAIEGRVIDG